MIKLCIVFGLLVLTGFAANAQKVHLGFRVGVSNTTYYGSESSK